MRLLLCCDATSEGGLGHFFRCLALAEEARGRGAEVWVAGEIEVLLALDICRELDLEVLPTPLRRVTSILASVSAVGADVVHVDSYTAPVDLLDAFRGTGVLLSSMEDGEYGRRKADVVIDPSPGAERGYRPKDGSWILRRGLAFAPIRKSITTTPRWSGRHQPPRFLVMMGGTDALSLAGRVCTALEEAFCCADVHVIGEVSGSHERLVVHAPDEAVAPLLAASDIVVAGAGTTVWELCHLGVPMALIQVADNQQANIAFAAQERVALALAVINDRGAISDFALDDLRALMLDDSELRSMSDRAQRLVDGKGVRRIVDAWTDAGTHQPGLVLRPADEGDASVLFDWRNDAGVRASSRNTAELDWSEHLAWLSRALVDVGRRMFIASLDGRPVGQLRFDREASGRWQISIVVDPAYRQHGIGTSLISAGESLLLRAEGAIQVEAMVSSTNEASIRLFTSAGYRRAKLEPSGWITFEKRVD